MLDVTALSKAVCKVVMAATGLPANKIIIGDPGDGAPSGSYCAVRIDSPAQFGQALNSQRSVPCNSTRTRNGWWRGPPGNFPNPSCFVTRWDSARPSRPVSHCERCFFAAQSGGYLLSRHEVSFGNGWKNSVKSWH